MSDSEIVKATIQVDMYRAASLIESNQGYKGLRIHALPGLHEFVSDRFLSHVRVGASVLDLAAGSGAMTQRLLDKGYDVTATDYVSENFRLHGSVPFFQTDLNDYFSRGREAQYEAIIASEIIEHLENPRHFMRECFRLLRPEGVLVISTPNIDNAASLATFLRSGTFQWFSDKEYGRDGHLTPISQWQLGKCAKEAGFFEIETTSFGDQYGTVRGSPRLLGLSRLFQLLMRSPSRPNKQIYVAAYRRPH
jgi:SAM-dependent methyltransferase